MYSKDYLEYQKRNLSVGDGARFSCGMIVMIVMITTIVPLIGCAVLFALAGGMVGVS